MDFFIIYKEYEEYITQRRAISFVPLLGLQARCLVAAKHVPHVVGRPQLRR